jgi:hypothetical protein
LLLISLPLGGASFFAVTLPTIDLLLDPSLGKFDLEDNIVKVVVTAAEQILETKGVIP